MNQIITYYFQSHNSTLSLSNAPYPFQLHCACESDMERNPFEFLVRRIF